MAYNNLRSRSVMFAFSCQCVLALSLPLSTVTAMLQASCRRRWCLVLSSTPLVAFGRDTHHRVTLVVAVAAVVYCLTQISYAGARTASYLRYRSFNSCSPYCYTAPSVAGASTPATNCKSVTKYRLSLLLFHETKIEIHCLTLLTL